MRRHPCQLLLIAALLLPLPAAAHVRYVLGDVTPAVTADWAFLWRAFLQPVHLALMLGTAALVCGLLWAVPRHALTARIFAGVLQRARGYVPMVPWMLRLSLGIALIGAGVHATLISPVIDTVPPWLPTAEVLLGFLLLTGFLLPFAACAAVVLYLLALLQDTYILGSAEFLGASVALLMLSDGAPGVDHLVGLPFTPSLRRLRHMAPLALRVGMGVAMLYLAVYEKFLHPHLSEQVVLQYHLHRAIPVSPAMWVLSAGLIEGFLGLCFLAGARVRLCAAVAFVVLSVSFFVFGEDVASHITLFGVLSALFVLGTGDSAMRHAPERT